MDATSKKIIDATMGLIRDKGYVATTTKDIARAAGVNGCTHPARLDHQKFVAKLLKRITAAI